MRVLGQRFPADVDAAVRKVSRLVSKVKAAAVAAAAAVASTEEGGDTDDNDLLCAANREVLREEALSALLVSTFAGAELAPRLPLEHVEGMKVCVCLCVFFFYVPETVRCVLQVEAD